MALAYSGPCCALPARYPLDTAPPQSAPAGPGSRRTLGPGWSERGPGFLHTSAPLLHRPAEFALPNGIYAPASTAGTPVRSSALRLSPLAVTWCIWPPLTLAADVYYLERVLAGFH